MALVMVLEERGTFSTSAKDTPVRSQDVAEGKRRLLPAPCERSIQADVYSSCSTLPAQQKLSRCSRTAGRSTSRAMTDSPRRAGFLQKSFVQHGSGTLKFGLNMFQVRTSLSWMPWRLFVGGLGGKDESKHDEDSALAKVKRRLISKFCSRKR